MTSRADRVHRWFRSRTPPGIVLVCVLAVYACTPGARTSPGEPEAAAAGDAREAEPLPAPRPRPAQPVVAAAEAGMSEEGLERVDSIIRQAIVDGVTPGATLAVGRHGKLVRLRGYGSLDWLAGARPATDSSLYDIASLTKVVATTTLAMMLADGGALDLHAPLSRYLPEWGGSGAKRRVTPWHLLTHSGGLAAGGPARPGEGRNAVVRRIIAAPLEYEPGTATLYSDWDIILLGAVLERITDTPLDVLARERVFAPVGMTETGYNPRQWWWTRGAPPVVGALPGDPLLERIAPTEFDRYVRHQLIHGDVHDPIAYAMGGVAGHAGLFSSARDLAIFAQMILDGGVAGGLRLIRPETVRLFTRRQSPASSRALGWDTPSGRSSAGDYFSARSFGHTGFTGTSLWIDPERDLFVVLLTNRVNPSSQNQGHVPLRRAVHDAVAQAITDVPVERREAVSD